MLGGMAHLLIVEDDELLRDALSAQLKLAGHTVTPATDGAQAQALLESTRCDAVILDLGLPKVHGMDVLRWIRQRLAALPVLILTARDGVDDRVQGLNAGADDYLTKPFALPELEVRIEALLARAHGRRRGKLLQVADLRLDLATLEATRAGQVLHLYPACRKLLEVLMQASPAAVTRQRLEQSLWADDPPDGDMLRSHIYELRRSVDGPFAQKLIHTLPRLGYRLAQLDAADAPGAGDCSDV